jgi:three-Cys-motif partner protein
MSKRQPALWGADPHTVAKIDILKGYLNAWFRVLGKSRPRQVITYIDGFAGGLVSIAGPSQYRNHPEGSPIAALCAARIAIQHLGTASAKGNVRSIPFRY